MAVDAGQQFHFIGAIAAEQGVINDEDVPALLTCQRCNGFWDDSCAQKAA